MFKFFKKTKKVYFTNKKHLIRIDLIKKNNLLYMKKPLILENTFKIKEKLDENFDVFSKENDKNNIFPVIKLFDKVENELNYSVKISETNDKICYYVLSYHKANIKNILGEEEKGVVFYIEKKDIRKKDIKFKLKIGKDFTYLELKGEKGLMVI